MAVSIIIEQAAIDPKLILVVIPNPAGEELEEEYVSAHRSYAGALAEALKLQREFAPAVLHDRVAVGGAHDAS